ncbi:hypothetical protein HH212_20440 [Massilia forsythiae]|uniref:Uncharacterized protein n=1 Tax=Massilia forsythiae TaxID=2728020 RepID=A0A7Z2ZUA4_9BURK|nr:hypothetical protein [Massilia forsythiae]QJE02095.1 hypothetical protein HH212_20440 [Massilia forsythiae]
MFALNKPGRIYPIAPRPRIRPGRRGGPTALAGGRGLAPRREERGTIVFAVADLERLLRRYYR